MEEELLDEQIEKQKEELDIIQRSTAIKILIIIVKILLLFVMPIFVAVLDHFVF